MLLCSCFVDPGTLIILNLLDSGHTADILLGTYSRSARLVQRLGCVLWFLHEGRLLSLFKVLRRGPPWVPLTGASQNSFIWKKSQRHHPCAQRQLPKETSAPTTQPLKKGKWPARKARVSTAFGQVHNLLIGNGIQHRSLKDYTQQCTK